MMKTGIFIAILASLVLLFSCSKEEADNTNNMDQQEEMTMEEMMNEEEEEEEEEVIPDNENYLTLDSDYLFDQSKLHTFELIIPEENLAFLDADPAAEEYVEGMLIFEGDTINPVGIRYKGSIGAFVGCLSGFNIFEPSGRKICTKLSMKVKINWEGREEKFFKLKKLQFHAMNNDPSQLRERLGYWLFSEMGVPTPRSVHSRLIINGEYVGLFNLVEQIDNRFVKYNYDDDEGNLYKEIWPLSMNGSPYSDQAYIDALKTNENDDPSIDFIKNLGQELANANMQEASTIVERYMDIDEIIAYAVVDRTIKHDDGPFHWYCGGGVCTNHNYFWYEEPTNQKLHLIPWDLDNAFENIISDANPVTPIVDDWGATSNNCEPFRYGNFGLEQWSAACDKLTQTWTTYSDLYNEKKAALINGPMSATTVGAMLEEWQNQIRSATLEASDLHDDAITMQQWESSVNQLKAQLEFARSN